MKSKKPKKNELSDKTGIYHIWDDFMKRLADEPIYFPPETKKHEKTVMPINKRTKI